MIRLNKVEKRYRLGDETVYALNTVDLTIERGEFVAIIGPSGSGKTTLMNILGLLDTPSCGSYYLDGKNVGQLSDNQLASLRNKKIGFVFQSFNLLNTMTAFENVRLPLAYRGIGGRKANQIVQNYFNRLGLKGRERHRPSELSGGQQQRVAIARALVGAPDILLADEPTGALDSKTSREIISIFKTLGDAGQTTVLITHNEELARHADRVISIVDGSLFEERMVAL